VNPQKIQKQVRLIDFVPTMLSLLKISQPPNLDGKPLPQNAGQPALMESMFPFLELGWSPLVAIRTEQWKFIRAPKAELYDVSRDPEEKTNLYASRVDVVKQLEKQMPQAAPERNKAEVSSETAEQLSALGYVSGGRNVSGSNLDPKDQIGVWNEIEKAVDLEISKPSESISILEKAQKRDPGNPMILGFLAQKYAEGGRIAAAKAILKKVLTSDPKNALALYRMASVCLKNNQPSEARQWAESLQTQEPTNADAWVLLGQANLDLGHPDTAAQNFEAALKIDPADDDLRVDLGNVYLQQNQLKPARQNFLRVLNTDGKNLQALNGMATSYFVSNDLTTAERYLTDARRLNANDAQTLLNLALLYSKQGKKAEAIALYRKLAASPDTPDDWKQEAARRLKELQ
jgi:tetratricopeptide (TPR) repeat protein